MTQRKVEVSKQPPRPQGQEETYAPLVDIFVKEDGTTLLVAEVPGARPETVEIRVDKGVLSVEADGRGLEIPENYHPVYTGFRGVRYFRAFALSDEIDRDRIEAALSDGVLTLTLPKAAAAQSRKIEIKGG